MLDASQPGRHRLLIVEDDEDIRSQIIEIFASAGFHAEGACDGDEALAILRDHASFDAILLDLMLPNTDGWEFRLVQRADPVLSTIPVIAMSANTSARARAIDADGYVSKPFEPSELVAAVHRVLDQRRLMHLDRLASLGRMAAGIAHEVNNPLTYVHASLVLARDILSSASAAADPEMTAPLSNAGAAIDKAIHGVDRIRTIMSGVRLFIRAPDDHRVSVDVRAVVESTLSIIGPEISRKANIEKELGEIPLMRGNPGQLGQLVVNLLVNAADSIAPGEPSYHRIIARTYTSSDGDVVLEIVDTGSGMSEGIQSKVFEPFFTTKAPGRGTGLGLSICHGIARSHDATITVRSTPGHGSSFRVVFPAAHISVVPPLTSAAPKGRLLIVEDNEHVADALAQILGADYDSTLVVHDGKKALALLDQDAAPFETILCDMHLGATSGKQIYERLRDTRPELAQRMVFMSGAVFSGPIRQFLDETATPCLMKPFNRSEFRKAVATLLAVRKASGTQMKAVALEARLAIKPRARG